MFKGAEAGTAINSIMARLTQTTGPAAKQLKAMGISAYDSEGNFRGMETVMQEVTNSMDKMTDAEKANAVNKLAGLNHGKTFSAMVSGLGDEYQELKGKIIDSDGALLEMRNTMKDNLQGAMENLSSAFEEIAISIGTALLPMVKSVAGFVQDLADKFNGLSEGTKTTIAIVLAATAGLALLVGPILLLIGFIPQIVAGFGAVKVVLAAITGPIGLTVAAIAGITAALVLAYNKVEWFREIVDKSWADIKNNTVKAFEGIKTVISEVITKIVDFAKKQLDNLKEYWSNNGEGILANAKAIFDKIKLTISNVVEDIVSLVKKQLDKFKEFWDENGKVIMALVKLYFENVAAIIKMVMGIIKGIFEVVWPIITNIIKIAWEYIKMIVDTAITLVLGIIQTVMKLIQGDWKGAWETIQKTAQTIMDNIIKFFKDIDLLQVGKDIINGLIKGIGSMASAVGDAVKKIAGNIKDTVTNFFQVKSPSRVMAEIGGHIGGGLAGGISDSKNAVTTAISGLAEVVTAVTKKNASEVGKISSQAEKDRLSIQEDYAKKRAELARKTDSSAQSALKKSKNKKGEIVITGANNVYKIRADASAKYTKLNDDEAIKLANISEKASLNAIKQENKLAKDRIEAVKTYVADKKSMEEMSIVAESEVWRKSIDLFNAGTKERVEAQKEYQKSLKTINDEVTKTNEEYATKTLAINETLRKGEEELTTQYEKSVSDRTKALTDFVGIFDRYEYKFEQTGDDLARNLREQVYALEAWQTAIERLSEKAIDKGLLEELRAMGPKALPQLMALNSMTDKQLSEYSDTYSKKAKLAREYAEKELIGMKTDTEKRIKELQNVANRELTVLEKEWVAKIKGITKTTDDQLKGLEGIGKNAGQGLLNGLASMEPALVSKARAIADAVARAMASALQVKSPSRVMMRIGEFVGEGLEVGMDNSVASVMQAARTLANAAVPNVPSLAGYQTPGRGVGSRSISSTQSNSATGVSGGYTQHLTINSPKYVSPAETARLNQRESQRQALAWGLS